MGPQQLGKILLFTALVLSLVGGLLLIFGRAGVNVRLGSLPGDIRPGAYVRGRATMP